MSGGATDNTVYLMTDELKAKISEEVGKALENSLSQFINGLQTTIVPVVNDMMTELRDSILQEREERRVLDVNPSPVKKLKYSKAPKKGITTKGLHKCKTCGKNSQG